LAGLTTIQRCEIKGHFVPIGSHGFYSKKTEKARFDQQPVEACAVVSACLQAYLATGKGRWRKEALDRFQLFLGDNDLQIALYIPAPVDAATVCTRTAPMRTRERNRRFPS